MTGWDGAVDMTLLRPLWLLALLPLAGFGLWLLGRGRALGDWGRAADPALLRAMAALGRVDGEASRVPMVVALASVGLVVVALAGPAVERRDTQSYRNLDGVLFLVDASDAVTGGPRWPQIQTVGRFAIASLGTRPGGLIVFAGDAYVATEMTLDHAELGQTFSLIDGGTVPDPGSRPARALSLAERLLDQAEVIAGDVILLTAGDGLGPASLHEAAAIAAQGARLSVIALDVPGPEAAAHAAAGGGAVFGLDDIDALADWLAEDARTRLEAQDYPLLFWKDLGRYVLAVALLPLLLLFRPEAPQ